MPVLDLKNKIRELSNKAFKVRALRIKPGLDDKILLSWNALMISGCVKAFEALSNPRYKALAVDNLEFILKNFKREDANSFYHTYKNGIAQYDAFLEDYALLIEALIDVYGITFDKKYLYLAQECMEFVIQNFRDDEDNLFYFTSSEQTDIPVRKKELYDNAMPSANSTMARNLWRLGIVFDNDNYKSMTINMLQSVLDVVVRYPSSFAKWASVVLSVVKPPFELAIIGENAIEKASEINSLFLPNKIVMASVEGDEALPLLKGRQVDKDTLIYLCQNYTCQMPVRNIKEINF